MSIYSTLSKIICRPDITETADTIFVSLEEDYFDVRYPGNCAEADIFAFR